MIHWVDAATSVPAEVRLYDRLFKVPQPEEGGGDFLEHLDPSSLEIVTGARVEASRSRTAAVGSRWQLERVGYFVVDEDTKPGALVLNRIVTLRDARGEKAAEAVAARRREEGEREGEDAAEEQVAGGVPRRGARARSRARRGVRDDRRHSCPRTRPICSPAISTTAQLFAAPRTEAPRRSSAKWMINELPRALEERARRPASMRRQFGELIRSARGRLAGDPRPASPSSAEMVATGKRVQRAARGAPPRRPPTSARRSTP